MKKLPPESVRGGIRAWLELHADKLGGDVLEVGSRIHDAGAWYLNNRYLAQGNWVGLDMQPGENVDVVADITRADDVMRLRDVYGSFSAVVCSEVLEHCARPWVAVKSLFSLLRPGGWLIVTVPFGFHRHAYPNDYWRMTDQGLMVLLDDAGFVDYSHYYHGGNVIKVNNGDQKPFSKHLEMHLFAVARRPE